MRLKYDNHEKQVDARKNLSHMKQWASDGVKKHSDKRTKQEAPSRLIWIRTVRNRFVDSLTFSKVQKLVETKICFNDKREIIFFDIQVKP